DLSAEPVAVRCAHPRAGLRRRRYGPGVVLAALTAVLGVLVAGWWHRSGDEGMAIVACGLATLLASPVSWAHHYVWIVPLAALLLTRRDWPQWFQVLGWLFVGWAATSP